MRPIVANALVAISVLTLPAAYCNRLVTSEALQALVKEDDLFAHAKVLQGFADATPEKNRLAGGTAHKQTVDYIYKTLKKTHHYKVERQAFSLVITGGTANFTVDGTLQNSSRIDYSPSGDVEAALVPIANVGCDAADYPAEVSGKIALISRGTCTFAIKVTAAHAAGAVGAIIYNNIPGQELAATLGSNTTQANLVPAVGATQEQGLGYKTTIEGGTEVIGHISVYSYFNNVTTENVFATTNQGDGDNIYQIGGHTDSVSAGPGINDDGSGTVALLDLALKLTKFRVKNKIRFSFWAAEEEGLVGSTYYTNNLPAEELAKIRLYNNFDMIASPNFVYGVYDGDGSAFNLSGPPGSAEAEQLFLDWFADQGIPAVPSAFTGRSDYQGFINKGVPAGGLFTGAEVLKTPEEAILFGGEAGVAYDINYHKAGDTVTNCNGTAWVVNTKAIAHTIGTYGRSWEGFPERAPANSTVKRDISTVPKGRGAVLPVSRRSSRLRRGATRGRAGFSKGAHCQKDEL